MLVLSTSQVFAQNTDLLSELSNATSEETVQYVSAFKSTRLILGASTTQLMAHELQFRVSHVFGPVSDGIQELYGLDQIANVDIALDYGINRWLSASLARSSDFDKTVQSTIKTALFRQSNTKPGISLTYIFSINVRTRKYDVERDFSERLEYVNQLIISRKLNNHLSLLLAPGWLHLNRVPTTEYPNSLFYTTAGISYHLTPSTSLNGEYHYVLPTFDSSLYDTSKNALSIGVDIETGGHVFQLFISNASRLQSSGYVPHWNNDGFFDGDIHFGFSIMRSFDIKHKNNDW